MRRSTWILLAALVGNWLVSTVAVARQIDQWSYERLFWKPACEVPYGAFLAGM